jgi:RNA polymerase sigma-70 factor (ECF subfamily)
MFSYTDLFCCAPAVRVHESDRINNNIYSILPLILLISRKHTKITIIFVKMYPMQHLSEFKHLLDSCIAGDREAQKVLYDQLASRMFPVCIRYVGDRMLAEDVLQEGFITLFTKLKSYKGDGSFDGWARRIFVTTALMSLRKKDALKMSEDLDAVKGMKAETTTQVQNIGYKELMELVVSLPPGFRTVFNMYAIEGYSHKEIAEALGITETTSRTQFSRARLWLQNKIKERENV